MDEKQLQEIEARANECCDAWSHDMTPRAQWIASARTDLFMLTAEVRRLWQYVPPSFIPATEPFGETEEMRQLLDLTCRNKELEAQCAAFRELLEKRQGFPLSGNVGANLLKRMQAAEAVCHAMKGNSDQLDQLLDAWNAWNKAREK